MATSTQETDPHGKKFEPVSQLVKHGWTAGSGLGRSEDGIKEAVKVKLKFDQAGIGHDESEQFTYHWWDHVFNKAAKSISVDSDAAGVKINTSGDCVKVSSKKGLANVDKKALLYGTFVKAASLFDGTEQKTSVSSSDTDSSDEDIGTASKLTDDQLMDICGGRTAHKAARHGLGLNGKLARIAQQEEQHFSTNGITTSLGSQDSSKHKKKKKKKKTRPDEISQSMIEIEPGEKRKKRKRKVEAEVSQNVSGQSSVSNQEKDMKKEPTSDLACGERHRVTSDKKERKQKKNCEHTNVADCDVVIKKKKSKRK